MDPVFARLVEELEAFPRDVAGLPVAPRVTPAEIRAHLEQTYDFEHGMPLEDALEDLSGMMRRWLTHVTHPRYFGNFNPSVTAAGVIGEALAALYNPQLAVWSHAPAAVEIERFTLAWLTQRLGMEAEHMAAHFCSGGAEANHTAVVTALTQCFPECGEDGIAAAAKPPVMYVSEGAHDSFHKIAHATGIGRSALRVVPVDEYLQLDVGVLRGLLHEDRAAGRMPFLVVATAGTTSAGVVDPLKPLVAICRAQSMWLHVDAAWGGAALLSPKLRGVLDGIRYADSVTWDAHKFLSVPMGAGMFFCRHPEAVRRAFHISADYMPAATEGVDDPYASSLQWSRRAIGLKVFLSLASHGAEGYAAMVDHQAEMGERLRDGLRSRGWIIENQTLLPVVCVSHPRFEGNHTYMSAVVNQLKQDGSFWLSCIFLPNGRPVIRACVTSYRTTADDIDALVEALDAAEV